MTQDTQKSSDFNGFLNVNKQISDLLIAGQEREIALLVRELQGLFMYENLRVDWIGYCNEVLAEGFEASFECERNLVSYSVGFALNSGK
ncbi:hypothetical protein Ciccas_007092 [Cichlidogyrus casuarinus]|uniref:Uncharacterized protein n=1 Tax=Cichlidogyrus casuarinus TaxID=1844966 RepID=A0ABD2Q451_9PLAT